jgi:transcriptional regulator with XRE-family HTH domain
MSGWCDDLDHCLLDAVAQKRTPPAFVQIGARIRAERVSCGLSQEEAASRAQVGYKHWQEIEGGRGNPTVRTLMRIAAALDVDLCVMICATAAKARRATGGSHHPRRHSATRPNRSP